VQLRERGLHGIEQIAFVVAVDEMADHLGVRLAAEAIALGLQCRAQLAVVLDDAVVHERDAPGPAHGVGAGAVAEMRVGVMHRGRTVGRPARVGDAGHAFDVLLVDLLEEFGHAGGAARTLQALGIDGNPAGVIAAVFQPLQALDQDRNDVAR